MPRLRLVLVLLLLLEDAVSVQTLLVRDAVKQASALDVAPPFPPQTPLHRQVAQVVGAHGGRAGDDATDV